MPEILPIIIGLVTGGLGIAKDLGAFGGGGGGTPAPTPTPAAPTGPTPQAMRAALLQQAPTIQSQTGGALSPQAWLQLMEVMSGQAGTPGIVAAGQGAINQLFGGGGGGGGLISPGSSLTGG